MCMARTAPSGCPPAVASLQWSCYLMREEIFLFCKSDQQFNKVHLTSFIFLVAKLQGDEVESDC